ncbi:MAG: tetratricopeptide repeat protein [Acidobacteria bacterium]|nr:tetratricopeptide repeat protein [Acidobacteriota bacterium]
MLRKGLILLAISLTVSLAAQAQAPAGGGAGGGGGTPGGGTPGGGNPGGGNPGGGRPGGGNNDGGFGGQQQRQQQQQQQQQMQRPIFLSGNVVLASGEAPIEPIMINRVCGMQKTPEGYTDSKGRFSFQVGQNQQFAVMDASIAGGQSAATGLGGTGVFGSLGGSNMGIDLSGCQLEADASGYRSDPIFLTRRRPMDRAEVGTIILTPLGGMQAAVVSATSLAAPKKAKASFAKAIKELGKGPSANLEKAIGELEKAVGEYPAYAMAWTTLGQAKAQGGDNDGAIVALEKAVDADPRYIRPYEPLVRLYIGKGDWEHAAELSKFVLSVNPADTKMRWYQAVSNFETGRDDDAISLLGEIQNDAEAAKQFPQSHHIMGLIYAKRGQFGEAAAAYNRYLELVPAAQAAEAIKKQLNEWEQLGII